MLTYLLEHHYGLILNDTTYCEESVILEQIDAGIFLADAMNFLAEHYEWVHIDLKGFTSHKQPPFLRAVDILRAWQAMELRET